MIFFSPPTEGRLIYLSTKQMPATKDCQSLEQIRSCLKESHGEQARSLAAIHFFPPYS